MVIAALGGSIEVPTIDGGRAKVKIPEGTQTNRQFRLKDKGMSILRHSSRGDMYIHAFVETPVNLTKKHKEILEHSIRMQERERRRVRVRDAMEDFGATIIV